MITVQTAVLIPTKPSSDDDSVFRYLKKAQEYYCHNILIIITKMSTIVKVPQCIIKKLV